MKKAAAAVILAFLLLAPVAAADVRIAGVDTSGYPEVRLTVVAPAGTAAPQLSENGTPAAGLQAVNLGQAKSVVLAVDRSQSMAGASIRDAAAAARSFVAAKGANDQIEIVTFGHQAVTLTGFSSSAADADAALSGLGVDAREGTALWDAVVRGATALAQQGQPGRVIVVVTDGQDVSSTATFAEAVAAARSAHASVYAIGIDGPGFTPAPLRALAADTGGLFSEASSSAQLSALYASIARQLSHTWQLRYVTAARPGQGVTLSASVAGAGTATRRVSLPDTGLATLPSTPPPNVLPASAWRSSLAPVVLAGAVGALVLLACWFAAGARRGSWLRTRLAPHLGPSERPVKAKRRRQGRSFVRGVVAATEQAFANVKQFRAVQRLLTRADLPLLASELLYICLGCAVAVALVFLVAGAPTILVVLFMLAAGAAPIAYVMSKARRRMKAFDNQLPDLLITVAASLKAGHSFRHAIQAVVDEGAEPTARELRRVLTETRLGRPMDEALAEMGERIGSKNLSFVLNAVTIQRQIGGSLAGLFDVVAETVRQRQQFARKIRSLTATGRMSAYVLGGLPFLVAALISLISPAYMSPLWHSSTGHTMVAVALVMLAIGSVVLKKIVSFRG
ncbi:MAG: type II secretion system F family protein [Acidobacteriota bacterium]|nr:type II secretion system F family protein [Acidobacteriota bacterium]